MDNVWKNVIKMYPNITDEMDALHKQQLDLLAAIEKFEDEHPVEGHTWECDPNRVGLEDSQPWYLMPQSRIDDMLARTNKSLDKQLVCVKGTHHFKHIASIKWCTYCGTVEVDGKRFYPEQPHFLPKNE